MTDSRKAIVYAVLVHLGLIAIVVVGMSWQSSPDAPPPMQAKVVSEADLHKEAAPRKRAEPKPAEPKKKREVEEKPRPDPAKLNEQKRREDEKRKADAKRLKDTEERRKAAESSLKEQLASEEQERIRAKASAEQARAKAEQEARAQKELERVEGLIRQKIERNWVQPAGWAPGVECVVRVRLIPTGEAVQATVVRSCGNPAFDRSVENAVYKASPLPLPEDKSLFEHFRELDLRFRPGGKS